MTNAVACWFTVFLVTDIPWVSPSELRAPMAANLDPISTIAQSTNLVVVVGAGVSTEAGLPSGATIRNTIFQSDDGYLVRRFLGATADGAGFFRVLSAYRDVVGDKSFWGFLRTQLKHSDTKRMEAVSKSYELLAHLFHHKKIQAIICLNFDELLDKAIELETRDAENSEGPRPIVSLSEFQAVLEELEELEKEKRLNPYLLKPHGTISRSLTIRLAEEEVRRFEEVKRAVLYRYLDGADVLALGWQLGDPDLLRILNDTRRPNNNRIFVVCGDKSHSADHDFKHHRFQPVYRWAADYLEELVTVTEQQKRAHRQISTPLENGVTEPEEIQGDVGALRHTIRSNFFSGTSPLFYATRERQLAVEIVMHALKARGQFEPAVLFDCPRITYLAEALSNERGSAAKAVSDILSKLSRPSDEDAVLWKGANEIGEPVYWLHVPNSETATTTSAILDLIGEHALNSLVSKFKQWPGDSNPPALDKELRKGLIKSFRSLTCTFDVDLVVSPRNEAAFVAAERIRTRAAFTSCTEKVFSQLDRPQIDSLRISTSTGEWLLRRDFMNILHRKKKQFALEMIVDDLSYYEQSPYTQVHRLRVDEVKRMYPNARIQLLPRKVHNMTGVADADGRFQAAVYFRRESKTPGVAPVFLEHPEDLETLNAIWDAMKRRTIAAYQTVTDGGYNLVIGSHRGSLRG